MLQMYWNLTVNFVECGGATDTAHEPRQLSLVQTKIRFLAH